MSTHLNSLFVLVITLFSISCVSAVEPTSNNKNQNKLCQQAKKGTLKLVAYNDPTLNAFLFDCVVALSVSGISKSANQSLVKAQRIRTKQKLIKTADFLLANDIDIQFKNEFGDTLLMTVIFSYFDKTWKEKTVAKMIKLGANINEKNNDGDSALKFAQLKGNKAIIKLLTTASK